MRPICQCRGSDICALRPIVVRAPLWGSARLPAPPPCAAPFTCQPCPLAGLYLPAGSAFSWGSVYLSVLPFSWGSVRPPDLVFLRPLSRFSLVLGRLTLWLASVGRESVEEPEGAAPRSDLRPTSRQSYPLEQALSQVACIAKKGFGAMACKITFSRSLTRASMRSRDIHGPDAGIDAESRHPRGLRRQTQREQRPANRLGRDIRGA